LIYFIQAGENGPIKIGRSNNPEDRLSQLQTANYNDLVLLWKYDEEEDYAESDLHDYYKEEKIRGEWFRPTENILDFIKNHAVNVYDIKMLNGGYVNVAERKEEIYCDLCAGRQIRSVEAILQGVEVKLHKDHETDELVLSVKSNQKIRVEMEKKWLTGK
jgi:hypothetical protein